MEQFEINKEHDLETMRQHIAEEIKLAEERKARGEEYDENLIGIDANLLSPEEINLYPRVQAVALSSESDRALTLEEIARLQKKLHGVGIPYGGPFDDEQKKQKFYETVNEERLKDTHGNFLAMLRNRIIKIQTDEKLRERRRQAMH